MIKLILYSVLIYVSSDVSKKSVVLGRALQHHCLMQFVYRTIKTSQIFCNNFICENFFTHIETSRTSAKASHLTYARHFWPWSSEVFKRVTLIWYNIAQLRRPVSNTPLAHHLSVDLFLRVLTNYVCRGWKSKIRMRSEHSNRLRHPCDDQLFLKMTFL